MALLVTGIPKEQVESLTHPLHTILKTLKTVAPFGWLEDTMTALRESKTPREYASHIAELGLLTGIEATTMATIIASRGAVTPQAAALNLDAKAGVKLLGELLFGITSRNYGETSAKALIKEYNEAAAREIGFLSKAIDAIRRLIPFGNEAKMWAQIKNEAHAAGEIFDVSMRGFSKEVIAGMKKEGLEMTFLVFDKSKTWLLNNLGREMGDLGLKAYFHAFYKVAKKYGIDIVRNTKEGDELVFILYGKNAKNAARIVADVNAEMKAVLSVLKVQHKELGEAIGGFSAHEISALIKKDGERTVILYEGKAIALETLLNKAETKGLLEKLGGKMRNALRPLMESVPGELPKAAEKWMGPMDVHIMVRVGMNRPASDALKEVSKIAEKAIVPADTNLVGPSLLNLIGHGATDTITSAYYKNLKDALLKIGIDAKIYSTGPMSFGIKGNKGRLSEAAVKEVLEETGQNFLRQTGNLGIRKVRPFTASAGKWAADKALSEYILGRGISEGFIEAIRFNIAMFNLDKQTIRHLPLDMHAKQLLENIPGWVRDESALFHYLRKSGRADSEAIKIMETISNKRINEKLAIIPRKTK